MRTTSLLFARVHVLLGFVTLLLFSGCGEDSEPITPQDDHTKAIGMVFESSGVRVASILRGETTDTLQAVANLIGDSISVRFYDEEEHLVDPPADDHASMTWQIDDPSIVAVVQPAGEEGSFFFRLQGLEAGATSIEFFILHGEHHDFRSGKIPVAVSN